MELCSCSRAECEVCILGNTSSLHGIASFIKTKLKIQEDLMKYAICGSLLLFATFAVAQQSNPPYQPPPYSTPPIVPDDRNPGQQMPPDTVAPSSPQLSSDEVQDQIQKQLDIDPHLQTAAVKATVSDGSIFLTGRVENQQQHDLALRIAAASAD